MRHVAYLVIGIAAILAGLPAFAQACAPRDAVVARLAEVYDEVARLRGLTLGGEMMEIYLAPSGTWTVVVTNPGGIACVVAAGEGGEVIEAVEGDPA